MTAWGWLALAAALALVPVPTVELARVRTLARGGRLRAGVAPNPRRGPRMPRVEGRAAVAAGGVLAATAAAVLHGPAVGIAAGIVVAAAGYLVLSTSRRRRGATRERMLHSAVRLLVAELEAGGQPAAALHAAATASPAHAEVLVVAATAAGEGAPVGDALLIAGAPELVPLGRAWQVAESAGTPLADVLGRVADDLAARAEQQRAVSVVLAGPRSSAFLLAGLPVLGIALGAAMGARPVPFLLDTPAGRALCCAGAVLDAAGVLWTQRLMTRAERA